MTLLDKYLRGATEEVYSEIYVLKQKAFQPTYFDQVDLVLKETFRRVAPNLKIIYSELDSIGYQFVKNSKFNWQKPLLPPVPDTNFLLSKLKSKTKSGRYIPLSLEYS